MDLREDNTYLHSEYKGLFYVRETGVYRHWQKQP